MGQRSRRRGVSNAALRAARAAFFESDDDAAAIGQRVYNAAVEARRTGEHGDVAVSVWAPLVVAAETVAPVVLRANGLPETEEMAVEVAAYLTAGFLAGAKLFDVAHFEAWRAASGDGVQPRVEPG